MVILILFMRLPPLETSRTRVYMNALETSIDPRHAMLVIEILEDTGVT